eukprot:CAMPEP_0170134234 /NCGR_PEP_ID=MMETSP0033_2-20121228/1773_1 /TAXON_ID=195969 /ORGANISM="Dolichomastix tenuilepis, Strain CCMP3274" /LENGTH=127 /DNA_ID=CAMNT_0010369779 /DNA_START=24 /DNA_END=407 /DNA_ORIENTATION=-
MNTFTARTQGVAGTRSAAVGRGRCQPRAGARRPAPATRALFGFGEQEQAAPAPAPVVTPASPEGVPPPPVTPEQTPLTFGFCENAERQNSRAAMMGFVSLLLVEAIAGKGLLEIIGIEVGNGIDIGF